MSRGARARLAGDKMVACGHPDFAFCSFQPGFFQIHENHPYEKCRAFTIVELLTVIAIIAILAAMLLPVLSKAKVAAQKKQAMVEISQIVGAIQQYDSVYGRFPISPAAQSAAAVTNGDFTYGGVFQTPWPEHRLRWEHP
jgi:prepilin-type N-terminal cleavage/methylation domain-containing protein